MADEPPQLTVVAEQSEAERDKQLALDELRWPAREMTANLLRVMRGAGRPAYLPQQIIDLAGVILEAAKHSNAWGIWSIMEGELQSALSEREEDAGYARRAIMKGSLQALASKLVYQNPQRLAGEREMDDGVEAIQRAWEESRRRWQEELAAQRPPTIPRNRRAASPKKVPQSVTTRQVNLAPPPKPTPKVIAKPIDEKPVSTAEFMKRRREEMEGGR